LRRSSFMNRVDYSIRFFIYIALSFRRKPES